MSRSRHTSADQPIVIVLSGHVGAGKTTLAERLGQRLGFQRFTTRSAILQLVPDTPQTRLDLQAAGEILDRESSGAWVAAALLSELQRSPSPKRIAVDSIRTEKQMLHIRQQISGRILHVHLTAPFAVLAARYAAIASLPTEGVDYSTVLQNETERQVDDLQQIADIVVNSDTPTVNETVTRVANAVGL